MLGNRFALGLLLAVAVVACGEPSTTGSTPGGGERTARAVVLRADGRDDAALNSSLDAMRKGMTSVLIGEFTDGLVSIGTRVALDAMRASPGDLDAMNRALREHVDGMSVAEILADGAER